MLRARDKLGIKNVRLRDLRHEATSKLFEKGPSPVEVASMTGRSADDPDGLRRTWTQRAEFYKRRPLFNAIVLTGVAVPRPRHRDAF